MARIKTEEYLKKVKERYGKKVEIISEFRGSVRPITICYHCEKHGDTVKTLNAKNVFGRNFNPCKGCLTEKKSVPRTNDKVELYNRLAEYCRSKGGEVLETKWDFAKSVYHFKCGNPDHPIFESTADSLVGGNHWCPWCIGRKGDFESEIRDIIEARGGEMIGDYVNSTTHIDVRCREHDYVWKISPVNLKKGRWCPICNMSINEKTVYDWLSDNHISMRVQYQFEDFVGENGNPYRFDFAVFFKNGELNSLIEIDDETHSTSYERYKEAHERDGLKDKYCADNHIVLHRVPIKRWIISSKGRDWYYQYIDEQLGFLKEELA